MILYWTASNITSQIKSQLKSDNARAFITFVLAVVALVFLALIGKQQLTAKPEAQRAITIHTSPESYEIWIRSELQSRFNASSIKNYLRTLTKTPHVAGTDENRVVAEKIRRIWEEQGLFNVHFAEYEKVLLSYPDYRNPNTAIIHDNHGRIHFFSNGVSKPIVPSEQSYKGAGVRFNAYSAPGNATGNLVYCNYGRSQDFDKIKQYGINLKGKIAIIRYGKVWRGEKAFQAQQRGAVGVIIYSDPSDAAKEGILSKNIYPNTVWMPHSGAQRGSLLMVEGDPLTPLYPAKNYTFRTRTIEDLRNQSIIPSIPVFPMSYEDANHFLENLGGRRAPQKWQGGLSFIYRLGPNFQQPNWEVTISVKSRLENRKIQNVIAYIPGVEPDRYVIIGNHYDAWVYGAVDPNSGTAVMLEMSRVFMSLINESLWQPERTLVFCAWDAEEYGLIGSTEWIEEHTTALQRAIAYLNVDLIPGNQTLYLETVPSLFNLAVSTAKDVPNPNQIEVRKGRTTIYDTWNAVYPGNFSWNPEIPNIPAPGGGSDHKNFLHFAGVPVVNFVYQNGTSQGYPLYHTLYETMFLVEELMDTDDFRIHVGVGQYWAELARRLVSFEIIPFNLSDYSLFLDSEVHALKTRLDKSPIPQGIKDQLGLLLESSHRLIQATNTFQRFLMLPNSVNERIRLFERCFLNPRGVSDTRQQDRHVIYGIDPRDDYKPQIFPGIRLQYDNFLQAKTQEQKKEAAKNVTQQISIVQHSFECAINLLAHFI